MRKVFFGLVVFLVTVSLLLAVSHLPIRAQEGEDYNEITKKLDEVLKNQDQMLKEIAAIKEELGVIKIRVTR